MFFKGYKKIHLEMASRLLKDAMSFSDSFYDTTLKYIPGIKKMTDDDPEQVKKFKNILVIVGVGISYSVFSPAVKDNQKEVDSLAAALEQAMENNDIPEVLEASPKYFDTYKLIYENSQDENYARLYGETVVCGFYDWDMDSANFKNFKKDSGLTMAIGSSLRTKYFWWWLGEKKYLF
tara:strand:- start:500 stop:1033 length:534 start_codon:yes stop_codon:yes gene_type:complete